MKKILLLFGIMLILCMGFVSSADWWYLHEDGTSLVNDNNWTAGNGGLTIDNGYLYANVGDEVETTKTTPQIVNKSLPASMEFYINTSTGNTGALGGMLYTSGFSTYNARGFLTNTDGLIYAWYTVGKEDYVVGQQSADEWIKLRVIVYADRSEYYVNDVLKHTHTGETNSMTSGTDPWARFGAMSGASTGASHFKDIKIGNGDIDFVSSTLTSDLRAYYPMGNFTDEMGNYDATECDGDVITGKIGDAYNLDGVSDMFDFPDTMAGFIDTNTQPVSWSFWINTTYSSSSVIIDFMNSDGTHYRQLIDLHTDGTIRVRYDTTFYSNTSINDGEWHHVVVTYDGVTFKIFVDGIHETSQAGVFLGSGSSSVNLNFGSYRDSEQYLEGSLDEVAVWTRALTNDEITDLYNSGDGSAYPFAGDSIAPTVSNIKWETTGGFTDDTLTYDQIIDYINASCEDETSLYSCNVSVYDPDNTLVVSPVNMTGSGTDYTYTTDFTLNKAGTWSINVTAYDGTNSASNSTTFTVSTVTQSLIDGYYGYDTEQDISNTTIESLANYDYDLIEIRDLATTIEDNWTDIKTAIERSEELGMKVGLAYELDYNLSTGVSDRLAFTSNITEYFNDLTVSPYRETVEYIKLIVNDTYSDNDYIDANLTTENINIIAKHISDTIGNYHVYYSNYNSSTLDTNYVNAYNLERVSESTNASLINSLALLTRTVSPISRVYHSLSVALKTVAQLYHNNIIYLLTDNVNVSTGVSDNLVSELDNGDLIVYNNDSSIANLTFDVGAGTDINGSDIWDFTNDILLENNSDGTITFLDIDPYSAILVGTEDIDHILIGSTLTESTVYESESDSVTVENYTDGSRDGGSDCSSQRSVELWDDDYTQPKTITYYGHLNVTGIKSPYVFDGYEYIVIADANDGEIDKLFWSNISIDHVLWYVSVSSYNQTNSTWLDDKKTEVDNALVYNESLDFFLDGLDAGNIENSTTFQSNITALADYIKTTKGRGLGINVFTEYQSFAQLADLFAMKESCTHKWEYVNGVDDGEGYNYSNQYFEDYSGYGDYNKSIWYNNHNIDVVCVPFIDRNDTAYQPGTGTNYTLMEKLYFKARVLGYDNIMFSTPNFNIAYFDKYYDVGTKLQSEPTVDNDLYSMRYSKGIVYYNSTSDTSWFTDGRTFNSGDIELNLYDNTAFNYNICINDYCGYSVTTAGDGWSYDSHTISFNESVFDDSYGHYHVSVYSGDGGFVGTDTDVITYGKHSYYNNSGIWTAESDAIGNNIIGVNLNTTKKTSIDTTEQITQSNSESLQVTTANISADYSFNVPVWSYPVSDVGIFRQVQIWNGTSYVTASSYTNSTSCTTDNPTFSYNTIAGIGEVGVCIDDTSSVSARVEFPSLSSRSYTLNADSTAPSITLTYPTNNTDYTDYNGTIIIDLDESGGNVTLNDTRWDYLWDNGLQFRFINNTLIHDGRQNILVTANDSWNNVETKWLEFEPDFGITLTVDYTANNTVTTDTTPTFSFTITDDYDTSFEVYLEIDDVVVASNLTVLNNTVTYLTSTELSYGTKLWKLNVSDGIGTTDNGINSLILNELPSVIGTGGGGGGSSTISVPWEMTVDAPTTESVVDLTKDLCNIEINPSIIILDSDNGNLEQTINVKNNENDSYAPTLEFRDVVGKSSVLDRLKVSSVGNLLPGYNIDVLVEYKSTLIGDLESQGSAVLVLVDDRCRDIIVPVDVDVKSSNRVTDYLSDKDLSVGGAISVLNSPITDHFSWLKVWALILIVGALFIAILYETQMSPDPVLNFAVKGFMWFFGVAVTSGILIFAIRKMIGG